MSRDIELVKRLSQEIGRKIEIRRQPRRDSAEYRKFARKRDAMMRKVRSNSVIFPNNMLGLFGVYVRFDGSDGSEARAILDEDERVVRLYSRD